MKQPKLKTSIRVTVGDKVKEKMLIRSDDKQLAKKLKLLSSDQIDELIEKGILTFESEEEEEEDDDKTPAKKPAAAKAPAE